MNYEGKTKLDFKITSSVEDKKIIIDMEGICGEINRRVLDTTDQMIRERLVQLGWTPPPPTPQLD